MAQEAVVIPEKIYFKIGEVCELLDVQAHVLRYWETEFSMLSPQKNKSGQRSYRRRDVEIALRIKQLLYNEMFTIAGARKKLQAEHRDGSKARTAARAEVPAASYDHIEAPTLFDTGYDTPQTKDFALFQPQPSTAYAQDQRDALKLVAGHLLELREMLKSSRMS